MALNFFVEFVRILNHEYASSMNLTVFNYCTIDGLECEIIDQPTFKIHCIGNPLKLAL